MAGNNMIKQIRIGILIAIIGLSVFTLAFVVWPIMTVGNWLAGLLWGILCALCYVCVREIGRVRKE